MNELRWDGTPGHYEVYYLTMCDPRSGCGAWIRYTMLAPLVDEPTCALWFLWMDPHRKQLYGHKETLPISALQASMQPFELRVGDAKLTADAMHGECGAGAWDLRWTAQGPPARHVHPLLERAKVAKTVLTLPGPDLRIDGSVTVAGTEYEISGARGGQAHLWGSKHALRWAWAHCNDFTSHEGEPRPGNWLDAVSVWTARFGRELGPSTPVIGRFLDADFRSISPLAIVRNASRFGLQSWHLEAAQRSRRIVVSVDAARDGLVGVTYTDPDGEQAYCYNSEIASMCVQVWDRAAGRGGSWMLRETLLARGRAHYEYAQRTPLPDMTLHVA